jgi:hypothetical protein
MAAGPGRETDIRARGLQCLGRFPGMFDAGVAQTTGYVEHVVGGVDGGTQMISA